MPYVWRWWETLSRPERIVAMTLATAGAVGIVNSTVWAIAVAYMSRQKALVALARERQFYQSHAPEEPATDAAKIAHTAL